MLENMIYKKIINEPLLLVCETICEEIGVIKELQKEAIRDKFILKLGNGCIDFEDLLILFYIKAKTHFYEKDNFSEKFEKLDKDEVLKKVKQKWKNEEAQKSELIQEMLDEPFSIVVSLGILGNFVYCEGKVASFRVFFYL